MKCCVITFPGSNCDHDAIFATSLTGFDVVNSWHEETKLPDKTDLVIIPGGFSYGDYLRCGAIARFAPIMRDVVKFADSGGYVIGICNGFQILTETQLLPGVLLRNNCISFRCCDVFLSVSNNNTAFTNNYKQNQVIRIPIAHGEGNYYADPVTINEIENENRVIFRYCDENGDITPQANPNGSLNNIAGIVSKKGNVLGMMPHPERYSDKILGCDDGKHLFLSLINKLETK
ncbi:Phosphoribosylformylglycinamidine synthase subunit PurQ [bioreactor metagenome]|uniref:Phosphoribosylformylglycinamidine synthase subunit PurQ n=1 Tax=bioreactor metagenome TaxID=1076179 RepID=A0A645B0V3_9ZZZZ